jgi:hypothetical protein
MPFNIYDIFGRKIGEIREKKFLVMVMAGAALSSAHFCC